MQERGFGCHASSKIMSAVPLCHTWIICKEKNNRTFNRVELDLNLLKSM